MQKITYQPTLTAFYAKHAEDIQIIFLHFGIRDRDQLHDYVQTFWLRYEHIAAMYEVDAGSFGVYITKCIKNFICSKYLELLRNRRCIQFGDFESVGSDKYVVQTEIKLRVEEFKKFCRHNANYHKTSDCLINEIDIRVREATKCTKISQPCYDRYRNRFLDKERLSMQKE